LSNSGDDKTIAYQYASYTLAVYTLNTDTGFKDPYYKNKKCYLLLIIIVLYVIMLRL